MVVFARKEPEHATEYLTFNPVPKPHTGSTPRRARGGTTVGKAEPTTRTPGRPRTRAQGLASS